jgi:hypothetical protein
VADNQKQASDNENKQAAPADAGKPASSNAGLFESTAMWWGSVVSKVWNAVTADGTLAAAARQGFDELGQALKAFPDAVQVDEPGTLWNPTQGEVAADRKHSRNAGNHFASGGPSHPWPSEIANQNRHLPGKSNGHGHENGHDNGHSM